MASTVSIAAAPRSAPPPRVNASAVVLALENITQSMDYHTGEPPGPTVLGVFRRHRSLRGPRRVRGERMAVFPRGGGRRGRGAPVRRRGRATRAAGGAGRLRCRKCAPPAHASRIGKRRRSWNCRWSAALNTDIRHRPLERETRSVRAPIRMPRHPPLDFYIAPMIHIPI